MKEFLKSSRRKLAFLLAVLLVLGNVNWETMVRAEDPLQNTILNTSSISEYFYGEYTIDLNEYKTDKNLEVSYVWTTPTPSEEDAVLTTEGSLTIKKACSGTVTAKCNGYSDQNISISAIQPTANVALSEEIGTLTYSENKTITLICSTGSRLDDFIFTPNDATAVTIQKKVGSEDELELIPQKATNEIITISVKLTDDAKYKSLYTNVNYSNSFTITSIAKENIGDITVKNGATTYTEGQEIQVTYGDSLTLSCSESTNNACNWTCTSSDTDTNYVSVGTITDESGNATIPLTIVKASEGEEGKLETPVVITVTKKDNSGNYNDKSKKIKITHIQKAEQADFTIYKVTSEGNKVVSGETDTITYIDNLTYEIKGEEEEGATYTYAYSSSDPAVAKLTGESTSGKFNILKDGSVTLTVTKTKPNYNDKKKTITLTVSNNNEALISNLAISDISGNRVAAKDAIGKVGGFTLSVDGYKEGTQYSVTDGDKNQTTTACITEGVLNITAAGNYIITATATKAGYNDTVLTYNLEVYKEKQTVSFDSNTIPSENKIMFADADPSKPQYLTLKASATEGNVSYAITNEGAAGVIVTSESNECKIKITKAGTIKVKASVTEGEKYKAAEAEIAITVLPKKTDIFTGVTVEGASDGGKIAYTTASKQVTPTGALEEKTGITYKYYVNDKDTTTNEVAVIEEETGVLTLKKAGTVTITVVASLDNYENTTKTYDLEVALAPQSLTFETANPDDLYYGTKNFHNTATVDTPGCQDNTHDAIEYAIVEGKEIASINSVTGALTFKDQKTGTVKVKASKAKCDQYAACEAEYSVTVKNIDTPENPYSLDGTIDEGSPWYRSNVTIKPGAGYKISESNSFEDSNWKDSLEVSTQGCTSGKIIYLKDSSTGGITGAIDVADFYIDTIQPSAQEISYSTSVSEKIIEGLTLGFYKEKVEITFTAKDDGSNQESPTGSGIAKFEWWTIDAPDTKYYSEQNKVESKADGSYTYTLTINEKFRNKVCFTAYDAAGNKASNYIEGKKLIILENDEPVLSEEYSEMNQKAKDTENGILYYNNSAELYLTLAEENFYAEDIKEYLIKKDGTVYDTSKHTIAEWVKNGDTNDYKKTITLTEDGHYVVSLKYNDPAKNGVTDPSKYAIDYTSKTIVVDKTKPERAVSYTTPKHVVNGSYVTQDSYDLTAEKHEYTLFYDDKATVKLEIKERNFDKDKVTITVIKNGVESVKKGSSSEFTWADENDIHTTSLTFVEDGSYVVKVSGKDLAENEMPLFESEKIIIDRQAPTIEVSFSEDIVKKYSKDSTDTKLYKVSEEAFAEDIVATITITTANFRASDVKFTLANSENVGLTVPNTAKTYAEYVKDSSNWGIDPENANRHIITVPFKKDLEKTYELSVNYTGLNLLPAVEEKKAILVIDNKKPIGADITSYTSNTITEGERVGYVYGGETKVTFRITETNFVAEDVKFYVNKDGIENAVSSDCIGTWTTNAGVPTCDITVGQGNVDGDYQVRMTYTDRSNNKMVDCYSGYIIIDTKKPVVTIKYAADDPAPINTNFYDTARTATITVQDRTIVSTEQLTWNFTAKDITKSDVTIIKGSVLDWTLDREGAIYTWTKKINLADDAIYSFSANGTDKLSKTSDTPVNESYTIDTTAPEAVKIEYSAGGNWIDSVLNTISFGYYKEPVTVTLTAQDNTSPIDYFVWNYTKRSDSNNTPATAGGETDGKITTVSQSNRSNTATATFTLTADEAKQYCGNISFTATNKAGRKSAEKTDGQRVIVVDTIAPTRKVEFISAEGKEVHVVNKDDLTDAATFDPNKQEDLILYYNDTMKVKFTITEANFYKEDVKVTVSKDGGEFVNGNVVWDESATDIHTGTLTLEENGNYVVKMFCYSGQPENKEVFTDRSGNAYTVYESSQITIDKVQPTTAIEFSKNVSKNTVKDEGDAKFYKLSPEAFGDSEYINATIKITTKNFRASDVNFVLKDTTLKVPGTGQTYAQYCANKAQWTHSGTGEEHTLVVPFAKTNAVHSFTVKYKGLNLMDADDQSAELVVDDTAPVLADETVYSTTTITEKISTEEQRVGSVYDKAATISLKLTEANFNKEDVKLTIYKNGAPVTTDYVVKKDWQQDDTAKEVYLYEVQLGTTSDGTVVEGDYQVMMTYTDRSHNKMADYVSKYIIIDKTKPEISINYGTSDPTAVNGNYYGSNRTVTITVQDRTIVDATKLYWTLTAVDVNNKPVSIPEGKESAWSDTGSHTWTKTIEFSTDAKYDFTVAPVDALGKRDENQQSFTIDKAKPANLTIKYSCDTDSTNGKWYENVLEGISFGYYKKPITVTMTATDVTSPIQSFVWSYTRKGDNTSIVETARGTISYDSSDFKQNGATATATFTLPQKKAEQYRGNISFTVSDMANNTESKADTERVVVYDNIKPTRLVAFTNPAQVVNTTTKETVSDYNPNQKQDLTLYYNTDMTATITVTEANFYPQDTHVYVNDEEISELTWEHTAGTDVYTAQIRLTENGSYVIKMAEYSDRSGTDALVEYESNQIIVDKDKPTLAVKFTENIAKNAKDGILYNQGQITEDGKATITVVCNNFRASDFVLNLDGSDRLEDAEKEEYIAYLKTDSNWTHAGNVHTAVLTFDKSKVAAYNMKLYFIGLNKLVTETIAEKLIMDVNVPTLETVYATEGGRIQEKGGTRYVYGGAAKVTLNLTEDYFVKDDVILTVLKDGKACPEAECTISEWTSTGTKHTRTIELGTGDVDGDYQIFMSYSDRSGNAMESLVSRYCIVDTKKPVVNITYSANDPAALNTSFYGANRTATLTVQDRTIVESEKLTWAFKATNILGQAVTIPAENISDWSLDTKTHTWTRVVKLTVDAIYTFSLNGTDCLGKTSDTPVVQSYTMDTTAPVDLEIKYSEGGNWVDNVLGAISFGYYKAPITVSLIAKDITSPMDYFDWTYTKRADSNNTPETAGARITSFTQAGDTATATFILTPDQAAQYCGNITFTATNKAGHQSAVKADENRVIVADSISPTRVVEFTPATQVINKNSRQTVETYDPNSKQDLILFYDKPMTITLKVTEANFYPQDAVVTVNDAETALAWSRNGDEYTSTVTLSADGDYVLKMTYADRSGNAMETYESSQITIDTVRPTITIDIVGSSPAGEYGDTKYYNSNTQAVVTIVEHNFRASDVTGGVVALSASEQGVGVPDFAAFLGDKANWVTTGDTHVATYPMTTDATYSFQATYTDLAKHDVSIATSKHCVDKEVPGNVTLSYSTPVVETLLEAISFKFYNAQATATVTATDETAGVSKIVYSLLRAEGASDTNLELLEQTITEDTITYNSGRRESTAQFRLPASDLRAGTQFNGTIKLVVYDRALNNVAYENNERVIIDNIAPQLDIQYNESTNERNNILYYGEDIHATLRMNEANFYREDVKVTVSRNNGGFEPITVNWSDTNADVHIGNFTLSEDGDYVVMVEYADKSTNQMVSYTSEQMTIDTDMPVVTISGVENRKPYASGTVGFTVSVSDTNLDSDSFTPQFSAWVKEGNTIVQKDMFELGSVTVGNDKNSCTYVVDNLPEDGIYTISTSVMDMVGHTVDSMHMDNENGTENDFVRFSVNRNGSTYYIDDATTLEMLGSFVPYDKAGNVVVREVNPTALSDVTVTMFKDEKTIALEETNNFRFDLSHNEGEWYEYSYTIFRSNFEEDGIYSIVLHSKDEAEHVAENNLEEKNVTISFAIDSTNPVLIVSNLEDGATYNANSYTVYMQASDNLKLSEATVSLDGKTVGSWSEAEQSLSADDTYEFTINESNKAQKVSVSLVDKAGNRTTQDYSVTVTTNAFVRIINNKPLLFGIAGGATGAVAVPVAGVALFGKKKLFFVLLNKLKGVFLK